MIDEMTLWHAYRRAALTHNRDRSPANADTLRAAHAVWVRDFCPEDAETMIAEMAARLAEAALAA